MYMYEHCYVNYAPTDIDVGYVFLQTHFPFVFISAYYLLPIYNILCEMVMIQNFMTPSPFCKYCISYRKWHIFLVD